MDSFTQVVLGASIGELTFGRKVGFKASFWGAIGGTIPDLDVFLSYFYEPIKADHLHRGFSHSLLFALLLSPILAWLVHRIYKRKYEYKNWLVLFFLAIFTHPLLDLFTTWGTQLFYPYPEKFALNSVFVIDPIYTVVLLLFWIISLCIRKANQMRSYMMSLGLILSTSYLFWGLYLNHKVSEKVDLALQKAEINYTSFMVKPSALNTIYWNFVYKTDSGQIHYGTTKFNINPNVKDTESFDINENLLNLSILEKEKQDLLKEITKGYFSCEQNEDTLIISDLRFGTVRNFTGTLNQPAKQYKIYLENNESKVEHIRPKMDIKGNILQDYFNNLSTQSSSH